MQTAATARAVMTTNKMTWRAMSVRRDSVTLDTPVSLRPQTPPVAGPVQRLTDAMHKCQTIMKESPLTVLGLSTKRSPKISEIIQQTKVLCEVSCPTSRHRQFLQFLQRVRIARNAGCCNSQSDSVRLSVRLSVRPSVTFRCFVQTNEDTILRFPASGRKILLVSVEAKFVWIFAGDHPQRGR